MVEYKLTPGQVALAVGAWERRQRAITECEQALDALVALLQKEHGLEGSYKLKGTGEELQLIRVDEGEAPGDE